MPFATNVPCYADVEVTPELYLIQGDHGEVAFFARSDEKDGKISAYVLERDSEELNQYPIETGNAVYRYLTEPIGQAD